jgi:hypothetical protein
MDPCGQTPSFRKTPAKLTNKKRGHSDPMGIPGFSLVSGYLRWRAKGKGSPHRLMLAGIYQAAFLNQWGLPEVQVDVTRLRDPLRGDPVVVAMEITPEGLHSLWIYKKRNSVLFFTKRRLVSHFTWRGFVEQRWREDTEAQTGSKPLASILSKLRRAA